MAPQFRNLLATGPAVLGSAVNVPPKKNMPNTVNISRPRRVDEAPQGPSPLTPPPTPLQGLPGIYVTPIPDKMTSYNAKESHQPW